MKVEKMQRTEAKNKMNPRGIQRVVERDTCPGWDRAATVRR